MIHFIKTDSTQPVIEHLAHAINAALGKGEQVLWLLSGGSAVSIAVAVRKLLTNTGNLVVMQVDERCGPVGHKDSNWLKLLDAGFDMNGVECAPILLGDASHEATAADYEKVLVQALNEADLSIGLLGIGADGHTAGILPGSPAVASTKPVSYFKGPDFERITITANAIKQLDLAIAYAAGKEKREALQNLQKDLPPAEQPAQTIKLAKQTYVYNDCIGKVEAQ